MKRLPLYLAALMTVFNCAGNIKYLSGDFTHLKTRNIPNIGEVQYLEFTDKEDGSPSILPLKGSIESEDSLRTATKSKTLRYDPFLFGGSQAIPLSKLMKMLGL